MKKLKVQLEDGTESVITVEGMVVHGMQFDGMDEIHGMREIRRASDVEFDIGRQLWHALIRHEFRRKDLPDHVSYHQVYCERRADAIRWEREYLNGG